MGSETLEDKKPKGEPSMTQEEKEEGDTEMGDKDVSEEIKSATQEEKEEGDTEMGDKDVSDKEELEKSAKKRSPAVEPSTPVSRPSRERKTVERYGESSTPIATPKGVFIQQGHGMMLIDIPNVAFKLSKRKPDENLQILHAILFGKKTKAMSLKRNIQQFSGFVWVENEEKQRGKLREKLDKCVKDKLLDFCDLLDIPVAKSTMKKEELSVKLLEFLESPHATTEVSLADKEQVQKTTKRKRKAPSAITGVAKSPVVKKKQKSASKVEDEAESADTARDDNDEDGDNDAVQKEDTHSESDNKTEDEEEAKDKNVSKEVSLKKDVKEKATPEKGISSKTGKKSAKSIKQSEGDKRKEAEKEVKDKNESKKASGKKNAKEKVKAEKETPTTSVKTPAKSTKSSASKESAKVFGSPSKSKVKKEKSDAKKSQENKSSSSKDNLSKPTGKKRGKEKVQPKAEPSIEEMHDVVSEILKEVDFEIATISDILRQLGTRFGVDLMHRKVEVKKIIEEVMSNMTDPEDDDDGEEAEENAEEGSGDKDEAGEDNDD
ncbi:hypothetical protein GIB67_009427 [Kingdonia uniflora]|uniref:DEK-C domain-containing protein n=1 Tax=Kingdonia uniflora TaxID=39325 RepID=A0A7J7N3R5_9MAGN|nr:hypothetical protein GIB67_009427 [Kingdonia uniflora]